MGFADISRKRHIKCDETKPACVRCTKFGVQCAGYELPKAIVFDVFRDEHQRRSYNYFCERAAPDIAGVFGAPFWNGLVLQLAYVHPAVRHAVVSVGAIYETLEQLSTKDQRLSKDAEDHFRLSMEQSNQAIQHMTKRPEGLSVEVILVVCLLFVCQQHLLGEWGSAVKHLESGMEVWKQWRACRGLFQRTTSPEVIELYIMPVLARVMFQYSLLTWGDRSQSSLTEKCRMLEYDYQTTATSPLPVQFYSLHEANAAFERMLHHISRSFEIQGNGNEHDLSIHTDLIPQNMRLMNSWREALDVLLHRGKVVHDPNQSQAVAFLHIQYQMARIFLQTCLYNNETIFDEHTDSFQAIVHWCEIFINAHKKSRFVQSQRLFGFDLRIILPLLMTTWYCRQPSIRRQAVHLLRCYDRQEGPWSSNVSADVAERIIFVEEQGIDSVKNCSDIPEYNRVRFIRGDFILQPPSPGTWYVLATRICLHARTNTYRMISCSLDDPRCLLGFLIVEYSYWPYEMTRRALKQQYMPWVCPSVGVTDKLNKVSCRRKMRLLEPFRTWIQD